MVLVIERAGVFPSAVQGVRVPLMEKRQGGYRPIGLLPLLPRIRMKARQRIAEQWESANEKGYLYAGPSKGADVAAWKQSARAEHASLTKVIFAIVLLDLVKAFENDPASISS